MAKQLTNNVANSCMAFMYSTPMIPKVQGTEVMQDL